MRSFIALFALAAIATVADAAAKTGVAEAAVATPEDRLTAEEEKAKAAKEAEEDKKREARAKEDYKRKQQEKQRQGCPEGFIPLAECNAETIETCVRVGSPLKYVSWLHLQYQCDSVGGYLPESTATTKAPLTLLLQSYAQLYGDTNLYLGATDITADGNWKWLSSGEEAMGPPADSSNLDCMVLSSDSLGTMAEGAVNCEKNSEETQIANICFAKVLTA